MFFNKKYVIYSKNKHQTIIKLQANKINEIDNSMTKTIYTVDDLFKKRIFVYLRCNRYYIETIPKDNGWDISCFKKEINSLIHASKLMVLDLCNTALNTNDCKFVKRKINED